MTMFSPMRLLQIPEAFDHSACLFEPKLDGFRALAVVHGHHCELVSRHGHVFRAWPQLAEEIAHGVRGDSAVLDGEIVCMGPDGRPDFNRLMFRREWPVFFAFDVLSINGADIRALPLAERKRRLAVVMPRVECRLLSVLSVPERGRDLFRLACDNDLEGIVAKWSGGTYQADGQGTSWFKIKNPTYSQAVGRRELFEQRREGQPRRRHVAAPVLRLA
jgi:bifunctional non-homologous end joining protein LigD